MLILAQSLMKELFGKVRKFMAGYNRIYFFLLDSLYQLLLVLCAPGSISCKHFEKYDADCPNISFE